MKKFLLPVLLLLCGLQIGFAEYLLTPADQQFVSVLTRNLDKLIGQDPTLETKIVSIIDRRLALSTTTSRVKAILQAVKDYYITEPEPTVPDVEEPVVILPQIQGSWTIMNPVIGPLVSDIVPVWSYTFTTNESVRLREILLEVTSGVYENYGQYALFLKTASGETQLTEYLPSNGGVSVPYLYYTLSTPALLENGATLIVKLKSITSISNVYSTNKALQLTRRQNLPYTTVRTKVLRATTDEDITSSFFSGSAVFASPIVYIRRDIPQITAMDIQDSEIHIRRKANSNNGVSLARISLEWQVSNVQEVRLSTILSDSSGIPATVVPEVLTGNGIMNIDFPYPVQIRQDSTDMYISYSLTATTGATASVRLVSASSVDNARGTVDEKKSSIAYGTIRSDKTVTTLGFGSSDRFADGVVTTDRLTVLSN